MKATPVPAPQPCSLALSHLKAPGRPPSRLAVLRGQLALLLLAAGLGTACRATNHVVGLSQPHTKPIAHQVQRLDAAFVADDGRLFLRTGGLLAGDSKPTTLMVALPSVHGTARAVAQRILVPTTAVRAGWEPDTQGAAPLRPVPVGTPLVLTGTSTYEWDWLRPTAGRGREVRLVRRTGEVERWEVLHLSVSADTGECRFTVFEVQPKQMVVNYPIALALLPLAMASDVVAVGTMTAAPVAFVGACVIIAPHGGGEGLPRLDQLEPVKQLRGPW